MHPRHRVFFRGAVYSLVWDPKRLQSFLSWLELTRHEFSASALQYASQAQDPHFKEALYSTLVDLKATTELLQMDSPELAAYLRSYGGLPDRDAMRPGAPIGPLSAGQVGVLFCACDLHFEDLHCQAEGPEPCTWTQYHSPLRTSEGL